MNFNVFYLHLVISKDILSKIRFSEIRIVGKLDIWIFGKSESRTLDNPSLARAVASLARTGNTSKYLGAFFRMGILKKFRLTDMSYFSSRHGVPGVPASLYWRMGGMGWDGMGWSPNLFFLAHISKTTWYFFQTVSYTFRTCFKIFFPKNSKKLKKITFFKNCRQNRGLVFFPLFQTLICKFLENNLIFFSNRFWSPQKTF